MNRSTDRLPGPQHSSVRILLASPIMMVWLASVVSAGNLTLKPESVEAWDRYVQGAISQMHSRLVPGSQFLWIDETAERRARVRAGEIVVFPATQQTPHRVPSGLIHDWIGGAFIPDVTLDDVLGVVRDYSHYKDN